MAQTSFKKRYNIVYINALHLKLRRNAVSNDSICFILGIDEDGYREVLNFFICIKEIAYVWEENLMKLKQQ